MNYTAQKSKFDLHSIKISSVGTWPATYILHHVGNIPTAFSGDPVKQLSFTACPESHQIWAIPDWEETDSCAWEPLEDPLPAALSPLMRRSQLVGPYWLQMWHFGRRRGWTCRQTSARLPVTALPPPSPGLWCLLWGVLLHGHLGLSPPSAPGSRWCKAELHLVLNLCSQSGRNADKSSAAREGSQPALQTQMAGNWWGHCFCITASLGDSSPQSLGCSLLMTNGLHLCSSQRLAINSAVTSGGFPHVWSLPLAHPSPGLMVALSCWAGQGKYPKPYTSAALGTTGCPPWGSTAAHVKLPELLRKARTSQTRGGSSFLMTFLTYYRKIPDSA